MPALPSAGRELVPYFSSPGECSNETLSQSKSDAARFAFVATVASYARALFVTRHRHVCFLIPQEKEKVIQEVLPTQCKPCSVTSETEQFKQVSTQTSGSQAAGR